LPHVPHEAAKESDIFGHAAHLKLKEGEAILERGELFEELFLGKLLFRKRPFVLILSVGTTFHDDAPLCCVGSCFFTIQNVSGAWTSIAGRRTMLS
jgi:hypothetical protein